MAVDPVTVAATKELSAITVSAAKAGLGWVAKWYRSYDLLIIGQERAGKTALYKFLQSKLLSLDGEPTTPTVDDVNSGVFQFEWPTDLGHFIIEFRNVGDRSGQIGPNKHAKMFVKRKPHLLIVVLDLSSSEETDKLHGSFVRWFEFFCMYVGNRLMNHPRRANSVSSRLRNIFVLLNKADTFDADDLEEILKEAVPRIRGILQNRLRPYFGGRVDNCPILPCSIVSNPRNGTLNDTVSKLKEVIRQLVTSTITH